MMMMMMGTMKTQGTMWIVMIADHGMKVEIEIEAKEWRWCYRRSRCQTSMWHLILQFSHSHLLSSLVAPVFITIAHKYMVSSPLTQMG
jgi:hypothetical protein